MADEETRMRVLFVCTHNSARSQMAEGMLRSWGGDRFEALSAGTEATRVRPEAIEVMREIGIDIGHHRSKAVLPMLDEAFAWVVTVCDDARESCPVIPGAGRRAHWSIADPSAVEGPAEARLAAFRAARDDIGDRVRTFMREARGDDLPQADPARVGD